MKNRRARRIQRLQRNLDGVTRILSPDRQTTMSQQYSFDSPDADLILHASCPTQADLPDPLPSDFRVHRLILAIASPVFRDMLSLPQPPTSSATTSLPIVDLSESPSTLDLFLRFIYPVAEPPIPDLSTLVTVFEPAVKYEAEGVISRLKKILVSGGFLKADPFRVYCIAVRWGFEAEAKIASRHTLPINILDAPFARRPQTLLHSIIIAFWLSTESGACTCAIDRSHIS